MAQSIDQIKKRKIIVAGLVGNMLEWYDFAVYGFFAPVLAKLFFPSDDAFASLIAAYGAFAAGFLMRPVGGVIFGHIGDRLGRKKALNLSVLLMVIPSLCIGLLPTFEQIGVAAGVLLVILRMLQGVAVGGEYTSSIVYLAENSPPKHRGFCSSWALFGAGGGILLGSLVGTLFTFWLSDAQLQDWGWRLPFLAGIFVAIAGLVLRRGMDEVDTKKAEKIPLVRAIRFHSKPLLLVFGLNVGYAVVFYTVFIYLSGWLVSEMQESHSLAFGINTASLILLCILIPFFAFVSDRIGRRPLLIVAASLMVVVPYPLVWVMAHPDPMFAVIGQFGFTIAIAMFCGPLPAFMAELFPAEVRITAVSVGYNLAFAIFGGTAPMVAIWLISESGSKLGFSWYLSAMALVSLAALLFMRGSTTTNHLGE